MGNAFFENGGFGKLFVEVLGHLFLLGDSLRRKSLHQIGTKGPFHPAAYSTEVTSGGEYLTLVPAKEFHTGNPQVGRDPCQRQFRAQSPDFNIYSRSQTELCRPQIEQEVSSLGVPDEQVKSINIVEKVVGGVQSKKIVGWIGWMRPVGVKGYLVIEVNTGCAVTNSYTRGDYRLEGVKHY